MRPVAVQLKDISKEYYTIRRRKVDALKQISLTIRKGSFFVILGPSGCGKSTLLNILAGLDTPGSGEILFDDIVVYSKRYRIYFSPKERNIAMVFQSYALYPHMNVFDNIAFPLKIERFDKQTICEKVNATARMLDIHSLLFSRPKELSGGQRQRVAMARALVREPAVLLLDEPLSNLDAQLRARMREELKKLQRKLGLTTIYVTHDQVEAMTLGDSIVVLQKGEVQQTGQPLEIYKNPANTFVANFLGTPPMNLIKATLAEENSVFYILWNNRRFRINIEKYHSIEKFSGPEITFGVRPEDIAIPESNGSLENPRYTDTIDAEIMLIENMGYETLLHVKCGEDRLTVKLFREQNLAVGKQVVLQIKNESIHLFNKKGINILF